MAHVYTRRVSSIPPEPPVQHYTHPNDIHMGSSPPPQFEGENGLGLEFEEQLAHGRSYRRGEYAAGAEDAARELEDSILGGHSTTSWNTIIPQYPRKSDVVQPEGCGKVGSE